MLSQTEPPRICFVYDTYLHEALWRYNQRPGIGIGIGWHETTTFNFGFLPSSQDIELVPVLPHLCIPPITSVQQGSYFTTTPPLYRKPSLLSDGCDAPGTRDLILEAPDGMDGAHQPKESFPLAYIVELSPESLLIMGHQIREVGRASLVYVACLGAWAEHCSLPL